MTDTDVSLHDSETFVIACLLWGRPHALSSDEQASPSKVRLHQGLMDILQAESQGDWKLAASLVVDIETYAATHIYETHDIQALQLWFHCGRLHAFFGEWANAIDALRMCVYLIRTLIPHDSASQLQVLSKLSSCCMKRGMYLEATHYYEKMLDLLNTHPVLTFWRGDIAALRCNVLTQLSHASINQGWYYYTDARTYIREAVQLMQTWMESKIAPQKRHRAMPLSDDGALHLYPLSNLDRVDASIWGDKANPWPFLYIPLVMDYAFMFQWGYLLAPLTAQGSALEAELVRFNQWLDVCARIFTGNQGQ